MAVTDEKKVLKASKWLELYRPIKRHVNILEKKIKIAKTTLRCENGMNTTSIGTIGNKYNTSDIVGDIVNREIGKIEDMEIEKYIYEKLLEIILEAVDTLKSDEKQIIYLYYLIDVKLTWNEVARIINKSEDTVRGSIRKKAIIKIYTAINGVLDDEIKKAMDIISE